jgi:hypothetical protein
MTEERQKRKPIDWETIEPLYRAGNLSNYQICEQYSADHQHTQTYRQTITEGAIRARAKIQGWQKDIADKVQAKIKEKLVRTALRNANLNEDQIIEEAAQTGVEIVLRHQKEIMAMVEHENILLDELRRESGKEIPPDLKISLKGKSSILKDLMAVRAQRIALERQANNIDATTAKDDIKKIEIELIGKN